MNERRTKWKKRKKRCRQIENEEQKISRLAGWRRRKQRECINEKNDKLYKILKGRNIIKDKLKRERDRDGQTQEEEEEEEKKISRKGNGMQGTIINE